MDVREIPSILYREYSQALGKGDEREIYTNWRLYHMRELNETHKLVGFAGAIGFEEHSGKTSFVLWPRVPEGEKPGYMDVFEPRPIIEIWAGHIAVGVWAYGQGELIQDAARVSLRELSLAARSTRLVSVILLDAYELATSGEFISKRYWEVEKDPGREYLRP